MANESPAHEPHSTGSNLIFLENDRISVSNGKVRYLSVSRFSEREISRQLAAVCNLLLLMLTRDFGVRSPETVTVAPSELKRGVDIIITRRD